MTEQQKALRYDQAIQLLERLIDDLREQNVTRIARLAELAGAAASSVYMDGAAKELLHATIRIQAFDDIYQGMKR